MQIMRFFVVVVVVSFGGGEDLWNFLQSVEEMWHLSFAENPQPPGDGVYGALGETPAPSSSGGSDPNEMSRSGTDLPHDIDGRESEGTAI